MSTYHVPIVMGIFPTETEAKEALETLRLADFNRDQIGVAWHQDMGSTDYITSLIHLGLTQEQAEYYDHEFRAGHPVVSVRPDGREREVYTILHKYAAYDYDQRGIGPTNTVQAGGYSAARTERQTQENAARHYDQGEQSIPIREERLLAKKQTISSGEVRLYKDVVTEQQHIDVPVNREEVIVERYPGNGEVSATPIGQEETIRLPLYKEQASFNKIRVETGEIVIGKRIVQENQHVSATVRRTTC